MTPGSKLFLHGTTALALGLGAGLLLATGSIAQDLRPGIGTARAQTAYDPMNPPPAMPALPDPVSYVTPKGATASGENAPGTSSRRMSSRTSKPVRAPVRAEKALVKPVFRTATGITDLPPPPEPRRKKPKLEEDPYAALGVDMGGITLRPALTVSGGYDDNPNRSARNRKGSSLLRTEGEVTAQSDWSRHEFKGELRGGYSRYFSAPDASRPDLSGKATLKLDFTRDTFADIETKVNLDSQRPGSPDLTANVKGRPLTYAYGASAGLSHSINPLTLSLRGAVDRSDYADATLTNGRTASQGDRNATQYGVKARAAYEATPGLKPFVEASADTRQFDQSVDINGFRRSSNGVGGRAGASFEITRLLTGEASLGYQTRKYEDSRLNDLRGLIGDASLVWSATELTTVTLRGTTELNDTTIPGVNGAVYRRAELRVAHALQRNLTVTGIASFAQTDYSGITLKEDTTSLGVKLDWKLSRNLALTGSFTNERLKSTAAGSDYTANIYLVGLRFQL